MSLTSPIPDPDSGLAFTAVGRACFYCHLPLTDPAIFWMGSGAEIYLHPDCLAPLIVRLCRDRHEFDCPELYRRWRGAR